MRFIALVKWAWNQQHSGGLPPLYNTTIVYGIVQNKRTQWWWQLCNSFWGPAHVQKQQISPLLNRGHSSVCHHSHNLFRTQKKRSHSIVTSDTYEWGQNDKMINVLAICTQKKTATINLVKGRSIFLMRKF